MRAIQILKTGGPEVLTLRDIPTPAPGKGEALIRIEASGVNFIDTYFREGRYPATLPYTLGQEAAGTVVSVGADVISVKPGDHVAWCGDSWHLCGVCSRTRRSARGCPSRRQLPAGRGGDTCRG